MSHAAILTEVFGEEGDPPRNFRGKSKESNWKRKNDAPVSVIRLPLDASNPLARHHLESLYQAAFEVKRALRRSARSKCRAYWAAVHERDHEGPKAVRERLGLSRGSFEHEAYRHMEAAPHLGRYLTKALAMHMADQVWEGTSRHLFRDDSGKTQGEPTISRYFDFQMIPGRAKSHTSPRKWETFRIHGSLAGHLETYGAPRRPAQTCSTPPA